MLGCYGAFAFICWLVFNQHQSILACALVAIDLHLIFVNILRTIDLCALIAEYLVVFATLSGHFATDFQLTLKYLAKSSRPVIRLKRFRIHCHTHHRICRQVEIDNREVISHASFYYLTLNLMLNVILVTNFYLNRAPMLEWLIGCMLSAGQSLGFVMLFIPAARINRHLHLMAHHFHPVQPRLSGRVLLRDKLKLQSYYELVHSRRRLGFRNPFIGRFTNRFLFEVVAFRSLSIIPHLSKMFTLTSLQFILLYFGYLMFFLSLGMKERT